MKLFILENVYTLGSRSHYFQGPDITEEEWKQICDELLQLAAWQVLEKAQEASRIVLWDDVMDELARLLTEQDFVPIKPAEASYDHQWWLADKTPYQKQLGSAADAIAAYMKEHRHKHWQNVTDS